MDPGFDPYAILGVSVLAGDEQIHSSYRSLARALHPDANPGNTGAAARFAEVTAAYELLHDPVRRRAYDLTRAARNGPRAARTVPGPTGNASVRGASARPAHRPQSPERDPARAERDEFAFLGLVLKLVLVLVAAFLVVMVFAALNRAPECGPGVDPSFCLPAPSLAP